MYTAVTERAHRGGDQNLSFFAHSHVAAFSPTTDAVQLTTGCRVVSGGI